MHVVLLNQFYPPDPAPTGRYLHDLARALVERGHRVTVLCSRHAYAGGGDYAPREQLDGVEVQRLRGFAFGRRHHAGKLADYAGYYAGLAAELLRMPRPDLIVALSTPPFVGLLASLVARANGHSRHAHWVMDVYPDVMQVHGMLRGEPLRALQRLAQLSYAGASAIVTLGPAMVERIRAHAPASTRVHWIPLWAPDGLAPWPDSEPIPLRRERGWRDDRLVLLYSGNFGLGHRFGEFLDAARELGPNGPIWAFAGTGRGRGQVERFAVRHPELPIQLLPSAPDARLREHLCSADVHLISMDARWEGTLLPSKLQASFAVGKPVIFVGDPHGDLARWIAEARAGWVVREGDSAGLMAALGEARTLDARLRKGREAVAFGRDRFDPLRNAGRLADACEAVVAPATLGSRSTPSSAVSSPT